MSGKIIDNNKNMKELFVKNSIIINADCSKVWDALVNPAKTKQYMFGCETVSDWKKGSALTWKGEYEGKEMIFVKGTILEIEFEKLLVYNTIDPHSSIDDISGNYLTVTYTLEKNYEVTLLNVMQGDYSKVAEGERRYNEASNNGEGWNPILLEIKKLVELKLIQIWNLYFFQNKLIFESGL